MAVINCARHPEQIDIHWPDSTTAESTQQPEDNSPAEPTGKAPENPPQDVVKDDPLHLQSETALFYPPARPRRKTWLWLSLSLLAAALLAAQYLFFFADVIGTDPGYRQWISRYCEVTGCELSPLQDLNKISSDQLMVYSHPEIPDALSVDAVLINEASFAQPFPSLVLRFENLQGEILAQRRFQPREYLPGDLADMTMMPARQPVKLKLELIDPGQDAVSYLLFIPK